MIYCDYLKTISGDTYELHKEYHDNHYGFPIIDDNELFERLMFEINQAGLSWILILKKQHNFRKAFDNYEIAKVASYNESKISSLLADKGIIRNRLKINAAIENAKVIVLLQKEFGSFRKWLDQMSKEMKSLEDWTRLFKKKFRFTGGEIVNEFLVSTGYLPGAHSEDCPVFLRIHRQQNR